MAHLRQLRPDATFGEDWSRADSRKEVQLAFAMGGQPRLGVGAGCCVGSLGPKLARMVFALG